MKKIIICFLLLVALLGCNNILKQEKSTTLNQVYDSIQTEVNLIPGVEISDEIEFYPVSEGLPLSIICTGIYHQDEVAVEQENEAWFGLFKDRDKYYLTPTSIKIRKAYDVVLDQDQNDEKSWTGWAVRTVNLDTSLILIRGLSNIESFEIKTQAFSKDEYGTCHLTTDKKIEFNFNNISYILYSESEKVAYDSNPHELVDKNFRLYLKYQQGENQIVQLLAASPFFDDASFSLLFVGDIDNDGKLDFLINTTNHYNVFRPTLYLSSFADTKSEAVRVVAMHESVGC